MASLSLLRVDQVEQGTFVRLLLPSASNSRLTSFVPDHHGFFRIAPGGVRHSLQHTDWRRVVGFNRRSFCASVVKNDTVNQELTLQIEEPGTTNSTQIRYELVLPYRTMMRLARLVIQGRVLSSDQEAAFRHEHVRSAFNNKQFFHPFDVFNAVELIAYPGAVDMTVNFTWQVPGDGTTWLVDLPADAFTDGNYTVDASFNTLTGSPAFLSMPDVERTASQFRLNASGTLTAGTTIDFSVKER